MASSTNVTTGVKAIKVSKTDALGNDQTLILQEGELLTLVFDDIGIQRFTIKSIAEYSDYYLYYVTATSLGNNESDFHVPEDVSGTGTGVINAGNYELQGTGGGLVEGKRFADFFTVNNLTNWNFNNSIGRLSQIIGAGGRRFGIKVQYQVEVYTNATTPDSYTFAIEPEGGGWLVTYNNDVVSSNPSDIINGNVVTLVAPTNGVGNARSITGSFTIVASNTTANLGIKPVSYYGAAKFFFPTGSINIDIQSFISGSSDDNGVNTVIEPYITENFAINDYNATMNNAVEARDNEFYMDVDYSSNAIVAVNSDTILDDSATRAKVQYSNYTSERVTRPRYDGSKVTSLKYNFYTPSGSRYNDGNNTNVIWGGDNSFGKEPVINQQGIFALYYDGSGVGDDLNQPDSIFLNLEFGFDDLGNILQPKNKTPYFWNGKNAFGGGNILDITVYNSESVTDKTLAQLQLPITSSKIFSYLNSPLTVTSGSLSGTPYGGGSQDTTSSIILDSGGKFPVQAMLDPGSLSPPQEFFSTASGEPSIVEAGGGLSVYLREVYYSGSLWKQVESTGAGMISPVKNRTGYDNSITTILPTIGQKVCFGNADINQAYTITGLGDNGESHGSTNYRFRIFIDKEIPNGTDMHKFIFLNETIDTSKIYIQSDLSGSAVGSGFIFNEFMSPTFNNNKDATITKLQQEGLI